MIRTLKTIWLVLLAGLLLGLFVYSVQYESRARQSLTVLSTDAYQEIVTSKKKIAIDKFAGTLLNNGTEAAVTNEDYLICAPLDADAAIKTVSFQGTSYQAAFAPDEAYGHFAEAVADNHAFQLVIWNGTQYFEQQVVFTSLPVMVFSYDSAFSIYSSDVDKNYAVGCTLITNDGTVMESAATIRVRGQLASAFPKIPYRLTLYRNRGTKNPQSLLGMEKSSEWVMLSLYTDPARIRDKVSLDLWNDLAATNPVVDGKTGAFEYCEVVVNGFYEGLYGIVRPVDEETLEIDDDENARFYQFNFDFTIEAIADYRKDAADTLLTLAEVKYPEMEDPIDDDVWSPLIQYSDLYCAKLRKPTLADLESLFNPSNSIDYALFTACASGNDNLFKNMYMVWRQDTNGNYRLYRIPWDLDFTWGNYYDSAGPIHRSFLMKNTKDSTLPYDMQDWLALDSGEMKQAFINRWTELRSGLFSESALQARMNEQVAFLQQNGVYQRDGDRWKDTDVSPDLTDTFAFLHDRLNFLDQHLAELAK